MVKFSLETLIDARKFGTFILATVFAVLIAACGGGGGSSTSTAASSSGGSGTGSSGSGSGTGTGTGTTSATLAALVGNFGGSGNLDGTGSAARFNAPRSVAVDASGNVFVADSGNNTIRKITPLGVVSTLAGTPGTSGSANGAKSAASFNVPTGLATDSSGNIYVADTRNNDIRKVTPVGVVTTLAGTNSAGFNNATGTSASFYMPTGAATDSSGNVYVADSDNNAIREISPAGVVTTIAGGVLGSPATFGSTSPSAGPVAVATDSVGNVYVADTNDTIIMIAPGGAVSVLAGTAGVSGSSDGTGAAASFNSPSGIAIDSLGNVYVADSGNNTIRMIASGGVVTTLAGSAGAAGMSDGSGAAARFNGPSGIATDSSGNVYVADTNNNTVRVVTSAGNVSTLAGAASVTGSVNASAANASFNVPSGIASDSSGNLYVADFDNNIIRKISATGVVTIFAGTAGVSGSNDGTGPAASFNAPSAVAIDAKGNLYVADSGNATVRKITSTGVVSTVAGTATIIGSLDGTGSAASFNDPNGIATDGAGNVYVADSGNFTIRKITSAGVVSTVAGTVGVSGNLNGTGAVASFNFGGKYLSGIATDSAGNVYLADGNNYAIRMITPAGVVTTLAGGQIGSLDGTGTAASFGFINGLVVDSTGDVYVADDGYTIRKVTSGGVVTTVVGVAGQKGFGAGALPATLSIPLGLAISGTSLYLTTANGVAMVNELP